MCPCTSVFLEIMHANEEHVLVFGIGLLFGVDQNDAIDRLVFQAYVDDRSVLGFTTRLLRTGRCSAGGRDRCADRYVVAPVRSESVTTDGEWSEERDGWWQRRATEGWNEDGCFLARGTCT